ncbi:MAG: DUF1015 domain-containing protein [Acidobacteria bacterium]|nr:DUF1015 domain-containing protein [Acidobacteriota bacterium]
MAIVKSFRPVRPPADKAAKIACVPYDVVSDEEVRAITAADPDSFLRVTRPETEFGTDDPAKAFSEAKKLLEGFISQGLLSQDQEPGIFVYRLAVDGRQQTGIVACCSVDDYDNGVIKKHEKTRPDKVRDRTDHMLALRAQTGLIFLAFRNTDEMRRLIAEAATVGPIYDFSDPKGVRQTVWRVPDPNAVSDAFSRIGELYVADGHHRAESASLARKELRDANAEHIGTESYNFVMAGIFPSEDLSIMAYNRVVKDLNGLSAEEFLARLQENFIVSENGERTPEERGRFAMYLGGKWYGLRFNVNYIREPDVLERLDVQILQQNLLTPILGIGDPRTDPRIVFVGGGRGLDELEEYVDSGRASVAFSLYPTAMDDLLAVSDMGEVMPPKSTWFEPKLKDGLFVHLI